MVGISSRSFAPSPNVTICMYNNAVVSLRLHTQTSQSVARPNAERNLCRSILPKCTPHLHGISPTAYRQLCAQMHRHLCRSIQPKCIIICAVLAQLPHPICVKSPNENVAFALCAVYPNARTSLCAQMKSNTHLCFARTTSPICVIDTQMP